ncbi:MAG: hypothetical protein V1816_16830 [Pseudomonadota bacterium]
MNKPEVRLMEWFKGGFALFKDNFTILLVAGIITTVISWASVGILSGPMLAGLILTAVGLAKKQQPAPGVLDVFQGFRFFMDAFPFVLFWGAIILSLAFILSLLPLIGTVVAVLFILGAKALLMFGLFLIVDKEIEFWPASKMSIETVKAQFAPFLALALVIGVLGWLGMLALGVGIFVTLPFAICILTVAYLDMFPGSQAEEEEHDRFAPSFQVEPTAAEPAAAEPTAAEPTEAEPTEAEFMAAEFTAAELAETEPAAAEPTETEPTAAEPAEAEPTEAEFMAAEFTAAEVAPAPPVEEQEAAVEVVAEAREEQEAVAEDAAAPAEAPGEAENKD